MVLSLRSPQTPRSHFLVTATPPRSSSSSRPTSPSQRKAKVLAEFKEAERIARMQAQRVTRMKLEEQKVISEAKRQNEESRKRLEVRQQYLESQFQKNIRKQQLDQQRQQQSMELRLQESERRKRLQQSIKEKQREACIQAEEVRQQSAHCQKQVLLQKYNMIQQNKSTKERIESDKQRFKMTVEENRRKFLRELDQQFLEEEENLLREKERLLEQANALAEQETLIKNRILSYRQVAAQSSPS
ncbi:hypothetical protein RCL1_002195 [Eukaryota sp. TZLM3-RCL]